MSRPSVPTLILFTFAMSLTAFAVQSTDVLMYLALARDFIFGSARGDVDPYLYARPDATLTWTHEWLSYVIFHAAWITGGVVGLIALKMSVLGLTFARVLRHDDRAPSPLWAGLWVLGMTAASFRFIERSSAFSDLALVILAGEVLTARAWSRGLALRLTLLFSVWAQLHPGYPLGFALLGLWMLNRRAWSWWVLGPIAAPLLNPDGWRGYIYPLTFALNEGRVFKLYNFEWFPTYHPAFRFAPESLAFWTFALVALTLLYRARAGRDLRTWLVVFGLACGTLAVRFIPFAVCLSLLVLRPWSQLEYLRIPRWASALALTCLLALSIKNFARGYQSSSGPRLAHFDFDPAFFPDDNLRLLREHRLPGRLYNSHDFGATLIWNGFAPVFHHGFVTDVAFYKDEVIPAMSSADDFLRLAAKYDWTMLLIEKRNAYRKFYEFLKDRPEWKIVGEDGASYLIYKIP